MKTKTGIELIVDERNEQLYKHNRSIELDSRANAEYQLKEAARTLLHDGEKHRLLSCPKGWNPEIWRKMALKTYSERITMAGALIAAELDRLTFTVEEHLKAGAINKLDNLYESIKDAVNGSVGFNTSPEAKIVLDKLVEVRDIAAENIVK